MRPKSPVILLSVAYVDNSTIPQTYELQSKKERTKIHGIRIANTKRFTFIERNFNLVDLNKQPLFWLGKEARYLDIWMGRLELQLRMERGIDPTFPTFRGLSARSIQIGVL